MPAEPPTEPVLPLVAEGEDSAADQAYFQAIEETFVALRGAAILLGPADYQVAAAWRRAGVPLDFVCRVLAELFARRESRGGRRRRVNSLRYFAPGVEEAWQEVQVMTGPGRRREAPPLDVGRRLAALARALPADLADRADWAERVVGTAAPGQPADLVERRLAELDTALLEAASARLAAGSLEELAAEAERAATALAARLPREEVDRARERLRRRLLRLRLGVPVLSLFSPEAAAGEGAAAVEPAPV
jgi:hypothetical protein